MQQEIFAKMAYETYLWPDKLTYMYFNILHQKGHLRVWVIFVSDSVISGSGSAALV
jgi:hypothetical protein